MDYKSTLNLPKTDFPMKANLPQREPEMLARWTQEKLYERIQESRRGREQYILHDGPPYANGRIHIGHALNKILKDIIVKSKTMSGYHVPYVPGWDCHGLPIENAIEKKHGRNLSRDDMQAKSRAYAKEQIALQMGDFKRLGILGDWADRYATMDPKNEAGEIRAFKRVVERGFVYRGLKPVYWCFDCGSSLAEFEIEYADKKSQTLDVAFLCAEPDKLAAALSAHLGSPVVLEVQAGQPGDTPALRDAAERNRRQALAEATIQQDPVVQELMSQFKTARIVPGSIKPLVNSEGSSP